MLRIVSQTTPATEPVTLAEAKAHCSVTDAADDTRLSALIGMARNAVERATGVAMVSRTVTAVMDEWPTEPGSGLAGPSWWDGTRDGAMAAISPYRVIEIQRPRPVSAVTLVQTANAAGDFSTVGSSTYLVDISEQVARLFLAPGASWPAPLISVAGIKITFTAGWADVATLQSDAPSLRLAVLQLVKLWYDSPDPIAAAGITELPHGVRALVESWVLKRI